MPHHRSQASHKLWLLRLVPDVRYGRWLTAVAILSIGAVVYGIAAWLGAQHDPDQSFPITVAAFFVAMVAYVVPVFHYITERTRVTLDRLASHLPADLVADVRHSLTHKSLLWTTRNLIVAVTLWLLQSRLLAGSWTFMFERLRDGYTNVVLDFGPLPVWLVTTAAARALVENAFAFRRIAREVRAEILAPATFQPIGAMAVTSTLFILGALATLPIMWLGGPISWWTTLPALLLLTPTVLMLLLVPVWPVHRQLLQQRRDALARVQAAIDGAHQRGRPLQPSAALANALALRREVARLSVWPFDIGTLTRLLAYSVIAPLTWAGAALIELLVNLVVGS